MKQLRKSKLLQPFSQSSKSLSTIYSKKTLSAAELSANEISRQIDEDLERERHARKREKTVKLLLLGQSESGKSTTLKHFQRLYAPSAFRRDRILWLKIIQLNILRSVRTMIDALSPATSPTSDSETAEMQASSQQALPRDIEQARERLRLLKQVELYLMSELVPETEQEATVLPSLSSGRSSAGTSGKASAGVSSRSQCVKEELFVRPNAQWKNTMVTVSASPPDKGKERTRSHAGSHDFDFSSESPQAILCACYDDIITLWDNTAVRQILKRRKVRMEDFPGFFLDDLARVTRLDYSPSDADVLKARLKTIGVSEYIFHMEAEAGRSSGSEWRIIDVGGSRYLRDIWASYFDDVNAMIFLAPISCFDQVLVEDRTVNRLEDSVLLWKAICSNKILQWVEIILFLNKCDLMRSKLDSGIRLDRYVKSYKAENNAESEMKFFAAKFGAIHRGYSPIPRKYYSFCTSVTDTIATTGILASVHDIVNRQNLRSAQLT